MLAAEDAEDGAVENAAALLTADDAAKLARVADDALRALADAAAPWSWADRLSAITGATPAFCLLASYARRWHGTASNARRLTDRLAARRALMRLRALSRMRWLACFSAAPDVPTERHRPPSADIGTYIQQSYNIVAGRAASAIEIDGWLTAIGSGGSSVGALLLGLLQEAAASAQALATPSPPVVHPCWVMGTDRHLTLSDWPARSTSASDAAAPVRVRRSRFQLDPDGPRPRVSALLSLWRGGAHIARFMRNITSQDGFREHCELVIVDAASPDGEADAIRPYLDSHDNIVYRRCDTRIGIYAAWNLAIDLARGTYLTSTNVDDQRRHDSLLLQAGVLDRLPFVDVVYQDFFYTLDPTWPFDAIERQGAVSRLPLITPHNLLRYNPPHNAPMWRRRLHDELGCFDASYESAADYEFWLRCLRAGKSFYKLDDPHVAYFHNPDGLSTRAGSKGTQEAQRARAEHAAGLLPPDCTMTDQNFIDRLRVPVDVAAHVGARRRFAWAHEALCNAALRRQFP